MKAENPPVEEWSAAYARVPHSVALQVASLVDQHMTPLAVAFYRELLAQPEAARLIPAGVLNSRLLPSIQRWMQFLFDPVNTSSPSPTIALQRHVGDMHARAGIPLNLVSQGFRGFKRDLNALLAQAPMEPAHMVQALVYVGELTDLALAEMLSAQALGSTSRDLAPTLRNPVADVHLPTHLEAERQEQLVALSDEENRFLRSMLSTVSAQEVKALGTSPFGLWLNHKAPLLFEEAAETAALTRIAQTIDHLDTTVLPLLQTTVRDTGVAENVSGLLREVVVGLEDIRAMVNSLFDRLASTDGYRDSLTQLFNRPLLASILRREMELARRKRSSFSVLLVDIDHFSLVNQMHGHETGDRVLQHVATLLATQVRSSDFVFRYGGEEFLILLVELDAEQSMAVAEKIRRTVENAEITLPDGNKLHVTLSLGVALYDGQPDPQSITALADQALDRAKDGGRNRVCLAVV